MGKSLVIFSYWNFIQEFVIVCVCVSLCGVCVGGGGGGGGGGGDTAQTIHLASGTRL